MFKPSKLILLFTMATTIGIEAAVIPPTGITKISPDLVNELKDFLDLIPKATVDEIAARHYLIDANFREVVKYISGAEFIQLLQQAQQIPEVIKILDYLHMLATAPIPAAALRMPNAIYDTVNMRSVDQQKQQQQQQQQQAPLQLEPQLNFVLLNELDTVNVDLDDVSQNVVGKSDDYELCSPPTLQGPQLHTFSSFVDELMRHLPRDRYVQLINQKCQHNVRFAQFYAALRSVELRPMVDAALKSSNLTTIIKTLHSRGVDVKGLEAIAFQVLSWGPAPISLP